MLHLLITFQTVVVLDSLKTSCIIFKPVFSSVLKTQLHEFPHFNVNVSVASLLREQPQCHIFCIFLFIFVF